MVGDGNAGMAEAMERRSTCVAQFLEMSTSMYLRFGGYAVKKGEAGLAGWQQLLVAVGWPVTNFGFLVSVYDWQSDMKVRMFWRFKVI